MTLLWLLAQNIRTRRRDKGQKGAYDPPPDFGWKRMWDGGGAGMSTGTRDREKGRRGSCSGGTVAPTPYHTTVII